LAVREVELVVLVARDVELEALAVAATSITIMSIVIP